jgi:hypothetical protein
MENLTDKQTPRIGWLKNGNTPGNPSSAPRCGAKTRRGKACQAPAMPNGRCRMHGGASTGEARTLEAWALFCRGASRAKACARAADPKSRALETDPSQLTRGLHGAWGSSAVLSHGSVSLSSRRTISLVPAVHPCLFQNRASTEVERR